MKPELEKISNKPTDSFMVRIVERERREDFKSAFHYHPEFELIWTKKSTGKRFIGNSIAPFEPGELIFLGKNIPHCWMTKEHSVQVVVQMREDFLGKDFINAPECYPLKHMFEESYRGIQFFGKTKELVLKKLEDLQNETSFKKLLHLLDILNDLAQSDEFEYLSTEGYPNNTNRREFERIQKIFGYIHDNYKGDISLDKAASLVNLTKSSFCKFIKKKTKKTFSQIVNEVRISKATDLLIETELNISQICYQSGFNDPSYFFKQFSKIMKMSPKEFRDSYH